MGSLMEYRRRILLNTPHVESASGSVAHFTTDMASKLKECKVNFLPQQAGSGDPSPSNVRAISGWTGCDVVRSGKNIVDILGYSAKNVSSKTATRSLTNNYGTTISTTDFSLPDTSVTITQSQWPRDTYYSFENGYISIIVDNLVFGQSYNVSFRVTNIINNPLNVSLNDVSIQAPSGNSYGVYAAIGDRICFRNVVFTSHNSQLNRSSFEIRICGMSFTLSEFMVTPVEDEDYTYAPYDPDEITVSWDNLGTIYGGFIDVLRGELVQEWYGFKGGWSQYNSSNGYIAYRKTNLPARKITTDMLSNMIGEFGVFSSSNMNKNIIQPVDGPSGNAYLALDENYSADDVEFYYPLATPITYPLTPEIIKAIKGVNNVFSDANEDVSVKYWRH